MDRTKILAGIAALALLSGCSKSNAIRVGSKNFTEQVLLGEIAAQHIENRMHVPVKRKLDLGGTLMAHEALVSDEIDLYPEYTGTAFTNVLKLSGVTDAGVILERVRNEYKSAYRAEWLDPLGFDNTFAMAVSAADARDRHLETLSDAANDPNGFALGAGYEFVGRPDGLPALNRVYQIRWIGGPKSMDLGLLYTALQQKQVSMVAGSMTDGVLSVLDAKVLKDDKNAFPAYQACYVVRSEKLASQPALRATLQELSNKISNDKMRRLNYEVDGKHRQVTEVAREFLQSAGLR